MFRKTKFHVYAALAALTLGTMILRGVCQDGVAPQPITAPVTTVVPSVPAPSPAPDTAASITAPVVTPEPQSASDVLTLAPAPTPKPTPRTSIEIDLQEQKAYLLRDGRKIAESPISSGRSGHLTPRGNFAVSQKDVNHKSSLYGKIVDKSTGRVVVAGADSSMAVPRGCKFVPAPMKYFLRFEGAAGLHAGILPGYPASHGCVRMPAAKAKLFYSTVEIGSPVHVFGSTPTRSLASRSSRASSRPRIAQVVEEPVAMPMPPPVERRGWFPFFRR